MRLGLINVRALYKLCALCFDTFGLSQMDIRVEETAEKFEEGVDSSGEVAPAVQSDRKGKGRAY